MNQNFELLLPVGHKDMALAAIHNGADAIFVGFPGFNARGRSYDHEIQELEEIIQLCHHYGVKVNLAFNILIFENEIPTVIEALKKIIPLKPDALIIQDIGLVQIVRQMCPDQVIHGSTQMTVTNDLAIQFLDSLNIKRFVLGRENSISEIKLIKQNTKKELEVFVHGALCVSYSGQCLTSESLGGRSANRGQCAQSCRLSYDLIVDGVKKNLVDRNYLVSPQDLCGLEEIPELMKLGVSSFKVEGRLKSVEYVGTVARSYRQIMDQYMSSMPIETQQIQNLKNQMEVEYSRGFFPGWLHGVNHQKLVNGTYSAHRGAYIGDVKSIHKNAVTLELKEKIKLENGDGLLFVIDSNKKTSIHKEDIEKGSYIFSIKYLSSHLVELTLANNFLIDEKIIKSKVYLNHAKEQKKEIEKSYTSKDFLKKIPISYLFKFRIDYPIQVEVSDGRNKKIFLSEINATQAQNKGLSLDLLKEEFSSLSGTIYKLAAVQVSGDSLDNIFIPHRELKKLRQKSTEWLDSIRKENTVDGWSTQILDLPTTELKNESSQKNKAPKLVVLLRELAQVKALVSAIKNKNLSTEYLDSVILDFEFGRDYAESLELVKQAGVKVGLATTRILKPQEYQNLKNIKNLNPDFILARNLGAIEYFKNINPFNNEIRADFSLNITNHLTADFFFKKQVSNICLSYDLNANQIDLLLKNTEAENCEVTIHQAMPSFHMEHCVFAAFLSQGSSYKDCGKPCEKHRVQLKDQFGNSHWIKPDHECRNTMFKAEAQTALHFLDSWKQYGLGLVRYEALFENEYELVEKVKTYLDVLENQITITEALTKLKAVESYGLGIGSLDRQSEYQSRKKNAPNLTTKGKP